MCSVFVTTVVIALRIKQTILKHRTFGQHCTLYLYGAACCLSRRDVKNNSELHSLCPFLNKHEMRRVSGRLKNSSMPSENQHQVISPSLYNLTELIVTTKQQRFLHEEPQYLLVSLRLDTYRKTSNTDSTSKMLTVLQTKAVTFQQQIDQLPTARVQPVTSFLNCVADYAGPLYVKQGSPRSKIQVKCYVSIFICLAAKEARLEMVTNCTSDASIAALRRFIARGGKCLNLYSDNGTTFVASHH